MNATLSANMTFPHFGLVVGNLARLSKAEILFVAPLVKSEDLVGWEDYAVAHQDWIMEDLIVNQLNPIGSSSDEGSGSGSDDEDDDNEEDDGGDDEEDEDEDDAEDGNDHDGDGQEHENDNAEEDEDDGGDDADDDEESEDDDHDIVYPGSIREEVYGSRPGSRYHLPIWQAFPTPTDAKDSPVMMDMLGSEWMPSLFDEIVETKSVGISPIFQDLNDLILYQESEDETDLKLSEPKSLMVQPIWDSLNPQAAKVAGVVLAVIEWSDYFDIDLGTKTEGMMVDLEYVCPSGGSSSDSKQRYTFRLVRENARYIPGDYVHDTKYEHMTVLHRVNSAGSSSDSDDESDEDDSEEEEDSADEEEDSEDDDGDEEEEEDEEDEDGRRTLQENEDEDPDEEDGDSGEEEDEEDGDSDEDEGSSDEEALDTCTYFVSIHATDAFVQNHKTNDAILFTTVVVSIFLLTGLVFCKFRIDLLAKCVSLVLPG